MPACKSRQRRRAAIRTQVSSCQARKALARARRYWAAVIRRRRGRKWPWIMPCDDMIRWPCSGDSNRCTCRSRGGRCEFPTLVLRCRLVRCRTRRRTSRCAARQLRRPSVTILRGPNRSRASSRLKKLLRGRGVPALLHQDVENDPGLVHCAPEVVRHAVHPQEHLIEVPGVARPRPAPAQAGCDAAAELQVPPPEALAGEDHAPLGQEKFDIAEAQAERVTRPDRAADDLPEEAAAAIQIGRPVHPSSLTQRPHSGQRRHS